MILNSYKMFESLCELIVYAILVLIVIMIYRKFVNNKPFPWEKMSKGTFLGKPDGGCSSCSYLAKPLDVKAT